MGRLTPWWVEALSPKHGNLCWIPETHIMEVVKPTPTNYPLTSVYMLRHTCIHYKVGTVVGI